MAINQISTHDLSTSFNNTSKHRKHKPSKLSNHSDTPLGMARFEHGSFQSFDTEIQDLIQQYPDTPIGGITAAPKQENSLPYAPEYISRILPTSKAVLRHESIGSDASGLMVTAAQSLRSDIRSDTFGSPKSGDLIAGSDILALSNDTYSYVLTTHATELPCSVANLDGGQRQPCCELGDSGSLCCSSESGSFCPGSENCPERPQDIVGVAILEDGNIEQITSSSSVAAPPTAKLNVPADLNLPVDSSGLLPEPTMPKKRRRAQGKAKFLRGVRNSRAKLLRRPVMTIVVGRQLGGPVSTALKAIAGGEIPDLVAITNIGVPEIPAPSMWKVQ